MRTCASGVGEIHPSARGFDRAAASYERARPDYPDEAVALIVEHAAIERGTPVLDLAAGTGKLSRELAHPRLDVRDGGRPRLGDEADGEHPVDEPILVELLPKRELVGFELAEQAAAG